MRLFVELLSDLQHFRIVLLLGIIFLAEILIYGELRKIRKRLTRE